MIVMFQSSGHLQLKAQLIIQSIQYIRGEIVPIAMLRQSKECISHKVRERNRHKHRIYGGIKNIFR